MISSSAGLSGRHPVPLRVFAGELGRTLALAAPVIAGNIAQMLMGLVDAAMAGRLGVTPLAACSFAGNVLLVPFVFGLGFLGGVTVSVARHFGAGRRFEAGGALSHGLALSVALGAGLAALSLGLMPFLGMFGQPPEVVAESLGYYALVAVSIPFALVSFCGKYFAEAVARPWPVFFITLAAVGLNALLNWALIFGTPLTPPLGLTGAGLATLLARAASAAAVLLLVRADPVCREFAPARLAGSYDRRVFGALWALGLPAAFQLVAECGAFMFAGIMMGWMGAVAIAAHQIAISCASTTFMIPLGVSFALSVRLGALDGAGARRLLAPAAGGAFLFSAGVMALAACVFFVFGRPIALLFIGDEAVVEAAAGLLAIAGVFQIFDGIQVTAAGGLRGLHDVRFAAVSSFAAYWAVALPAGWALAFPLGGGPAGVWWGLCAALGLMALALLARLALLLRNRQG